MGAALFYHMTQSPIESLVPLLLTRALGEGWRVELRGGDAARLAWLDARLWLGDEEGFLPHGMAGGPHDAMQPVLLRVAGEPAGTRAGDIGAPVAAPSGGEADATGAGSAGGAVAVAAPAGGAANRPQAIMAIDGAPVDAAEVAAHERVWILFDGGDPAATEHARAQWRALTAAGASAQYWSEAGGRWEKKAES